MTAGIVLAIANITHSVPIVGKQRVVFNMGHGDNIITYRHIFVVLWKLARHICYCMFIGLKYPVLKTIKNKQNKKTSLSSFLIASCSLLLMKTFSCYPSLRKTAPDC